MKQREKGILWGSLAMILLLLLQTGCSEDKTGLLLNGSWNVEENSQLYGTQHYIADISQIDSSKIEITNFYNIGAASSVTAYVNGQEIAIPSQKVGGYIFKGSGEIGADHNNILFTYTANDGAVIDNVIAQYKR